MFKRAFGGWVEYEREACMAHDVEEDMDERDTTRRILWRGLILSWSLYKLQSACHFRGRLDLHYQIVDGYNRHKGTFRIPALPPR
jgi:hypothetical protein